MPRSAAFEACWLRFHRCIWIHSWLTLVASDTGFLGDESPLLLWGVDPRLDLAARRYRIVAGRFLSSGGDHSDEQEVVLVEDYAAENKIHVGDDLRIITPDGGASLRVVGLMSKEGPGRQNNGDFGVLPLGTAQALWACPDEFDQIDVVVEPAGTVPARPSTRSRRTCRRAWETITR